MWPINRYSEWFTWELIQQSFKVTDLFIMFNMRGDSIEFIYIFECLYLHIFSSLRLSFRKHFILYVYLSIKSLVSQEMRWKWGEKLEKKGSLSKQSSTYSNIFTYFRSSPCILLIFSVLFSSSSGRRNGIWHSTDRKDDGTVRIEKF